MSDRTASRVLLLDALINLLLGGALLAFRFVRAPLGIPESTQSFYPTILGGVLLGVGLALLWETFRREDQLIGLGLGGAVAINLSGGVVLTAWLLFGRLDLPLRGELLLWLLAGVLVVISLVELRVHARR
jgi:hypothetical protein